VADLPAIVGLQAPVSRRLYFGTGVALMVLKYALDAGLVFLTTHHLVSPLLYLLPIFSLRFEMLVNAPDWVPYVLALGTIPFVWIGASMSVRRARDAGLPGALGLLFFMPFVNYVMMAVLSLLPTARSKPFELPLRGHERAVGAALVGVLGGGVAAAVVSGIAAVTTQYGGMVFVGVPFLASATAGLLYNLRGLRGVVSTVMVGSLTVLIGEGLLLLFGIEGAICLFMAAPLALVLATGGAIFGRELARVEGKTALLGSYAVLPLVLIEPMPGTVHPIVTTVDIAAPPEAVWNAVVAFPEITDLPDWYFRLGVAYPIRAEIAGSGVGAVRRCEFSTGAFVEPITVWDPPRQLAFDVAENPPTLRELGPWDGVLADHPDVLRSERGEFRLEPLPDGGTRLIGTTWYRFDMAPGWYWTAWSDAIIHRIHLRVLEHIGRVAGG
jgi:uncharacterized membrane protein YhaH (DUF805 family)